MPHHFKVAAATLIALAAHTASAKDSLNIGIVTFSTSDVHTNQMIDTMSAEAKSKGWTVENLNANGDPSQAIAEIKQLVTKKVDAIIVTVFDSTGLAAGLQAAADAKIPVLTAGGGMAPGIALAASTGAAQPLVDLMVKNIGGSGTVLDLSYHPGIPCRERADAFDAAVKAHPGLKATTHEITHSRRRRVLPGCDKRVAQRQRQREGPVRDLQLLRRRRHGRDRRSETERPDRCSGLFLQRHSARRPSCQGRNDDSDARRRSHLRRQATGRSDSRNHQGWRRLAAESRSSPATRSSPRTTSTRF